MRLTLPCIFLAAACLDAGCGVGSDTRSQGGGAKRGAPPVQPAPVLYKTPSAAERGLPCLLDTAPKTPSTLHARQIENEGLSFIVRDNHGAGNGEFNGLSSPELPDREFGVLFQAWNLEHIFDGVQHNGNEDPATANLFEPRQARAVMDLYPEGESAAMLRLRPTPFWGLEAVTRFEVVDRRTVDIVFSTRLIRPSPKTRWFGLFWASYPSSGEGLPLWFPGRRAAGAPLRWIRGAAKSHLVENTWVHEASSAPISFRDGYPDKLFTSSAEARELVHEPVFYSRLPEQLTFVTMLDGGPDVRLTQSPVSAWDAQWIVHGWTVGTCYTLRARLLIDEDISPEDVLTAYGDWMGEAPLSLPPPASL